jgi:hypothetical protein
VNNKHLNKTIGVEWLFYSPVKQQWCSAYNTNGTVESLIVRAWFDTKADAKADVKSALRFREGLVADCQPILDLILRLEQV